MKPTVNKLSAAAFSKSPKLLKKSKSEAAKEDAANVIMITDL